MSEPMETGGVGKNPAIDKINNLTAVQNRANAVLELERRTFQTEQPRAKEILQKRRKLMEDFQINFKRKGGAEDGGILHEGEQRLYTGKHPVRNSGNGHNRNADEIPGRILSDGRREAAQVLSVERAAGHGLGES